MKRFLGIASLALVLALGGVARAADETDKPAKPGKAAKADRAAKRNANAVVGKVRKIEGEKITLLTRGKNGGEVVVAIDASTKVKVNGQDGTLAQIKEGMRVVASPKTGTAKRLNATDAKAAKGDKAAKGSKKAARKAKKAAAQ